MTNEEKAKEIARINQEYYVSGSCPYVSRKEECYNSTLNMAGWKDEQFKKLVKSYIDIAYHECSDAHLLEELLKDI